MIQFIGSEIQIMKLFSLYQWWGGAEALESSFLRAVHGKIGSYRSFECTWHCHLVIELALAADCQLRRHVLTDYFHCPVRWFWLTNVLDPIGLIGHPLHVTPPYASLQLKLWMWRHCISLKHWLTSTNVWGQNFTNHTLNFNYFWRPKITLHMCRLLISFMFGIM